MKHYTLHGWALSARISVSAEPIAAGWGGVGGSLGIEYGETSLTGSVGNGEGEYNLLLF